MAELDAALISAANTGRCAPPSSLHPGTPFARLEQVQMDGSFGVRRTREWEYEHANTKERM
jgi:hypothetical protein